MFPIRCFTCGKVIGQYYEQYVEKVKNGENIGKVLDEYGIKRFCCRRMFLGHSDTTTKVLEYSSHTKTKHVE